jgi:hypothetical protein
VRRGAADLLVELARAAVPITTDLTADRNTDALGSSPRASAFIRGSIALRSRTNCSQPRMNAEEHGWLLDAFRPPPPDAG